MFYFLIKVLFFIIFSINFSFAEIVNKIEINGNKRISNETILVLSNIKKGKDLNEETLNDSLKKLYDSNFFSDINYSFKNGLLKINLKENPVIEKINISGIKKQSYVDQIYDSISLKDRMSFTENSFKNDITLIKNILKTSGYYFSEIKSQKEINNDLNSVVLNIDIKLGNKAKIKEIIFLGDKKIKDKKLLEIIASEEHKF